MGFIASSPQWVVYSYSIHATIVFCETLVRRAWGAWKKLIGQHELGQHPRKKGLPGRANKNTKKWMCDHFAPSTGEPDFVYQYWQLMEDALPEIPNLPLKIPPGNMAPLGLLQKSWALCWALIFSHACGPVQRSEIRGRVFFVGRNATWLTVDHVFSPRIFSMLKPKKRMGLNLLIRFILFQYVFFMPSEPQETLTIFDHIKSLNPEVAPSRDHQITNFSTHGEFEGFTP